MLPDQPVRPDLAVQPDLPEQPGRSELRDLPVRPGRSVLRDLPGVLTAAQLLETVDSLVRAQQSAGSIPWPDGHTDAWDHVECAMAMVLGGRLDAARAAYGWLAASQRPDGSWATSYDQLEVLDAKADTNQCAYVAVGVWQWWQLTGELDLPRRLWPVVRAALDYVVGMQAPSGALHWAREADGTVVTDALLTGSASSYQSLRCGIALAELLGEPQPEWELAAGRLQHAVAHHREAFLDKDRFSMDWYYPVLGGALRGAAGVERIDASWATFIVPDVGARCVSDRPWVTGAETAELAIALLCLDDRERALQVFTDVQHLREADGSYWTGLVFDEGVRWPAERSSWTAAAMVLAADCLVGGPTLALFTGEDLPTGVLLPADACGPGTCTQQASSVGEGLTVVS